MKYLLILITTSVLFASCSASRETIRYAAYAKSCSYPDGFGMDTRSKNCNSGTISVRSRDIIKRTDRAIKVADGHCATIYITRQ